MAAARSAKSPAVDGKSTDTERPDPRELQGHFDRLEEIADALSDPDTPLDQGLKLYGEGVDLLRKTKAIIEEARRQIQVLDEDAKGNPIVLPWDDDADEDDEDNDAPGAGRDDA